VQAGQLVRAQRATLDAFEGEPEAEPEVPVTSAVHPEAGPFEEH
jgi:hypothetical protein